MRDEIAARLQRVNATWEQLARALRPAAGAVDEATMVKGQYVYSSSCSHYLNRNQHTSKMTFL